MGAHISRTYWPNQEVENRKFIKKIHQEKHNSNKTLWIISIPDFFPVYGDALENHLHPGLGGGRGSRVLCPSHTPLLSLGEQKLLCVDCKYMACFHWKKRPVSFLELTPSPAVYGISFLMRWLKPVFQLNVGWGVKDRVIKGIQRSLTQIPVGWLGQVASCETILGPPLATFCWLSIASIGSISSIGYSSWGSSQNLHHHRKTMSLTSDGPATWVCQTTSDLRADVSKAT